MPDFRHAHKVSSLAPAAPVHWERGTAPSERGAISAGAVTSPQSRAARFLAGLLGSAVIFLLATACAHGVRSEPGLTVPEADGMVDLYVENRNSAEARIFVDTGQIRVRVGTVPGFGRRRLRVPRGMLAGGAELRLTGELIASRVTFTSATVPVPIGSAVEWRIEPNPNLSTLAVRHR